MEKKYILEKPRIRGMLMTACCFYADFLNEHPGEPFPLRNLEPIIDEYVTEYDEVEID